MKLIGIDLAGNPRNGSGFCILDVKDNEKIVTLKILYSDEEIIENVLKNKPDLVAIDAPLTYNGRNRRCDSDLFKYGALPVTLKGMEMLALRGTSIAKKLRNLNIDTIEVFATASGKILGFYNKNEKIMQRNLILSGLRGDIEKRFLTKDEIDAIFSAITAFLHLNNSSEEVGDDDGKIVIPKI